MNLLAAIIDLLKDRFQIVYNRPLQHIREDHQESVAFSDFEMIRQEFPDVLLMDEIYERGDRSRSFNTTQFQLYANCIHFISVQGGGSVLSSYFGGTNLIFAKRGQELACNAYSNWYQSFADTRIHFTDSEEQMLADVKNFFMQQQADG